MGNVKRKLGLTVCLLLASAMACSNEAISSSGATGSAENASAVIEREDKIPADAVKMLPETDPHPPILLSDEFTDPVPIPGAVNTAGAEDSPFITPDGNTLYFFFSPDVHVPVEQQLSDGITGIYVSHKEGGTWGKPERIVLQDPGKAALDGCEYVWGDWMWFCSTREGFTGIHWFSAERMDGRWQNWELVEFNPEFKVGELHLSQDGRAVYFGSDKAGGQGKLDIWVSVSVDGGWQEPVNLAMINTADDEGWPALNPAGDELWFYRNYGIWRSKRANGEWQAAEQILSTLAGEPTLDEAGNLYFVHHYFVDDRMIEADIYVAYHK